MGVSPTDLKLSSPHENIKPRYDAVIVGSGYGGGVSASRLARMGLKVCVLERGREFQTGDFPTRFPDLKNNIKATGDRLSTGSDTALYDFRAGADIHVLIGRGLGGGSLINAGVALRPDPRVFEHAAWPDEIARTQDLDEAFTRAKNMLRPATHAAANEMTKYKALERAGNANKPSIAPAEVVVSFFDNTNPAGVTQPQCTLCGDCCSGCNVGAKNTVALTYLPDAHNHGAEIYTQIRVSHIERTDAGWRIMADAVGDKESALEITIEAETIILAAGTLGSTEILLRSRDKGLKTSSQLGKGFSANGDIIAFGYGADEKVNAIGVGHPPRVELDDVGACVSGQIKISDPDNLDHEMYVQEGVLPSPLAPLLPMVFIPGGRILGALKSLVKGVYNGPFAHLHTFFAVSHDSAQGEMTLNDNQLKLSWPDVANEPVFARLDAMLEKISNASGADYVKNPLDKTMVGNRPATAHPLGGCAMGRDASDGVVNHKCQVYSGATDAEPGAVHGGLYVCDGSVIPRSLGVNPLLTITALTERAMMLLARDQSARDNGFDTEV